MTLSGRINTPLSLKYRFNNIEFNNQQDAMWSRHYQGYFTISDSFQSSTAACSRGGRGAAAGHPLRETLTCWVVAKQYSAVLRMLQMRQSSSNVNFATSEPSFSFNKLVMVSPPLLLVVLEQRKETKTVRFSGTQTSTVNQTSMP